MIPPSTNHFYAERTLNLAHRGANRVAPENTLSAFRAAVEMGADGVELDVQLSKDGEIVVIHNFDLDLTTDGRGPVKRKTLAELKTLDAGSHFSPEFAGTSVPTLQEVFVALGPVLLFNIELKTTSFGDEGLEAEVVRLIEDHNMADRVVLSSFNPLSLRRARRTNPHIPLGLLWDSKLSKIPALLFRLLARPDMLHPHWTTVTPQMSAREKDRGTPINVWTCNEAQDMTRLVKMGVNSIITDRPDRLKRVLDAAIH